jgi:hypothetical protein
MTRLTGALVVIAFGLASSAGAQSLGEAARREKERRAADAGKQARVFTDDDLAARRSEPGAPASPATEPAPPAARDEGEAAERERLEKEWRQRFADARERIRRAEDRAWRDVIEPVLSPAGVYVPMRVRKFVETEELRAARRALEDLEDELRRAGGPAGWGRE